MRLVNFDMDVMRTFCAGIELGSFAKAADRLGRSASAVSLQLRKIEEQAGQALVIKHGRGLVLTEAGEIFFSYAKRILELNDEAHIALADRATLDGWVRIGIPQDFAETSLPPLLGQFARTYPRVRMDVRVDRGAVLCEAVKGGTLDLALTWGHHAKTSTFLGRRSVHWVGAPGWRLPVDGPVQLAAFDAPCTFRSMAINALDGAGISWRHAFSSPGLSGLWAAVTAGLGVTARTAQAIPAHLAVLAPQVSGLPHLPPVDLVLHEARPGPSPAASRFRDILLDALSPDGETARTVSRIEAR